MNRVAVRDDRPILWGMEATYLDLYWNMPKRNEGKSGSDSGKPTFLGMESGKTGYKIIN